MTASEKIKILLAYDGSDLALDSVRYIGDVFPADKTEVVVFYVETKIPRSFWHMEKELDFRFQTPQIRATMAERKKKINLFMQKAEQILLEAGLPLESIQTKVHIKIKSIVQDIIVESHQGYDALVIGRKGHSRIKDFFIGTLPMKLLEKIKNIPLIVVGKNPEYKNILIAFDGTREIIKAVKSLSRLVTIGGCKLLLCHSPNQKSLPNKNGGPQEVPLDMFDVPKNCFLEAGFSSSQIFVEIISSKKNPTRSILDKARNGDYGTIIIGRRRLTPLKRLMFNRVGNKIFQNAENHVIWVVQ